MPKQSSKDKVEVPTPIGVATRIVQDSRGRLSHRLDWDFIHAAIQEAQSTVMFDHFVFGDLAYQLNKLRKEPLASGDEHYPYGLEHRNEWIDHVLSELNNWELRHFMLRLEGEYEASQLDKIDIARDCGEKAPAYEDRIPMLATAYNRFYEHTRRSIDLEKQAIKDRGEMGDATDPVDGNFSEDEKAEERQRRRRGLSKVRAIRLLYELVPAFRDSAIPEERKGEIIEYLTGYKTEQVRQKFGRALGLHTTGIPADKESCEFIDNLLTRFGNQQK